MYLVEEEVYKKRGKCKMKFAKVFWRVMFVVGIAVLMGSVSDVGDMRTIGEIVKQFLLGVGILVVSTPPMFRSLPKEFFTEDYVEQ